MSRAKEINIKETSGFCRYCKQSRIVMAPENATQEELSELATKECNCKEAEYQRKRDMQFKAAEAWAKNTFEDNEHRRNAVIFAIKAVFERRSVESAAFKIGKYTYKIDMDGDDCIRIKKTFKDEDEETF